MKSFFFFHNRSFYHWVFPCSIHYLLWQKCVIVLFACVSLVWILNPLMLEEAISRIGDTAHVPWSTWHPARVMVSKVVFYSITSTISVHTIQAERIIISTKDGNQYVLNGQGLCEQEIGHEKIGNGKLRES